MILFFNLLFSPYTWDLMGVISFALYKFALAHLPYQFLTAHKRMPFHTQTFVNPADLTVILHNNHHISRHDNYSAEAVLVYLGICEKCLLVNISQVSCLFPMACSAFTSWIYLEYCVFANIELIRIVQRLQRSILAANHPLLPILP